MPEYPQRGLHIALEGPKCAGKTTQLDLLHVALYPLYKGIQRTRDYGTTEIGELIGQLLSEPHDLQLTEIMLLFAAQRIDRYHKIIRPALAQGRLVLSDREGLSGYAFQGYGERATSLEWSVLELTTQISLRNRWPDLTVVLDIPVEVTLARLAKRKEGRGHHADDADDAAFHHRVRQGYLKEALKHPDRIVVVDGMGAEADVQNHIRTVITARCNLCFEHDPQASP